MQNHVGIIPRGAVLELGLRFGWITPFERRSLDAAQARHVIRVGSRWVVTAKGFITIDEFRRLWALHKGKFIDYVQPCYSPIWEELTLRSWVYMQDGRCVGKVIIEQRGYGFKVFMPTYHGYRKETLLELMGIPEEFHMSQAELVLARLKELSK